MSFRYSPKPSGKRMKSDRTTTARIKSLGVEDQMSLRRRRGGINIIDSALVNFNQVGIETNGGLVTAWRNSGTGGSAYDLDTVLGVGANLTKINVGGHDAVKAAGGVGLETSFSLNISTPLTIFLVCKLNALTGITQTITAARNAGSSSPQIQSNASDSFAFNAGINIVAGPGDTDLHLHTVRHNGDPTTKYEVSDVGSFTGDAGSEIYQFGTLFANISGAATVNADVYQFLIFDKALTDVQVTTLETELKGEFNT